MHLIEDRLKSPAVARLHRLGFIFSWERATAPAPLHISASPQADCVLNPQEFREMPVEDASNTLKVLH